MKKQLSLLLALTLLLPAVTTACSDAPAGEEQQNAAAVETAPEEAAAEEPEYSVTDAIAERYRETDLGGYEYKVMAPGVGQHFYASVDPQINEVWSEGVTGAPVNDAIYNRNLSTEETLNITVTPVWPTYEVNVHLQKDVLAGATEYDAVLCAMNNLGGSMQSGHLLNLKNIPSIDTADAWWDKNIVRDFTVLDRLYWITGDINIFDDFAVEVAFFNKRICNDIGYEPPYSDVLEGKWTLDRFYELSKAAELDVNGDGVLDIETDVVGHTEQNNHILHWIYAMGERAIGNSADGSLELRGLTERQIDVVNTLFSFMVDKKMTYTGDSTHFRGGHTLFLCTMLGPINSYRDMEDDFGVLPMPKFNKEQESYGAFISNGWTTAYGIPMTNPDPERTGVILDCLCGYSTDTLRVALYDVLFAAKLVRDAESTEMLNIIFASKSYDWAVDFPWHSSFGSPYNNIYESGNNNFVSNSEKSKKMMNTALERLIASIEKLDY